MFKRIYLYLKNIDWLMFSSVFLLISFGLAEIYSVSLGRGGADLLNFKKQLFFVAIGLAALFFLAFFDYHNLRNFSNYIFLSGIILLLAVLLFGQTIRGTRGWFNIAGFGIQPVEFVKFALILFLARHFSASSIRVNPLKNFIVTGGGTALFSILVLAQPDFGSALILIVLWIFLIAMAGLKKKYLLIIFLILVLIFGASWSLYLKDYQKQRIKTFFNPSFDPLNQGYNVAQAIIAVGAGGLTGRGIGFGSQSQLKFLPESQTDFIFAVVAEELGFFGVALIMLFFFIFFYRCLVNIRRINNDFAVFFILGAASLIFIEMFINIAMNIGLLPVVGISLPFLSYGGSAMISNLMLIGVIQSIVIRSKISY